mgnify:CR=1 FL=1
MSRTYQKQFEEAKEPIVYKHRPEPLFATGHEEKISKKEISELRRLVQQTYDEEKIRQEKIMKLREQVHQNMMNLKELVPPEENKIRHIIKIKRSDQ